MNCQLCQEKMEAYRGKELPEDMMTHVKEHLDGCSECSGVYRMMIIAESVMESEKENTPDPFLATRVMAHIEQPDEQTEKETVFSRVLRPALITVSLAAALFFGILLGSIPSSSSTGKYVPEELAMADDLSLEAVGFLVNE
jgi:predicted anti-sigma-YlaC factor YlaD